MIISTIVPTIWNGDATPAAIRSGMRTAENGGIQLSTVLHVASGLSIDENAAKNIARMMNIKGPEVALTSS